MKCNVAAQLILTRLKLDDLLDAELMRLRQQELKCRQGKSQSGSGGSNPLNCGESSPVIIGSFTSSQPASTDVSRSVSASTSVPFELPDVNISDLLNASIHSLNNVRSSVAGYQRNSSVSLPGSPAACVLSRQLSSTHRGSKKKAGIRKKADKNCSQDNLGKVNHNLTANNNKPLTLTAGDSRKRQNSGHCSLAVDSDEEFTDSWSSNRVKKRVQEVRQDDQNVDCLSSAAAAGNAVVCEASCVVAARAVVDNSCDESCIRQDMLGVITDVTNSPASVGSVVCSTPSSHLSITLSSSRSVQQTATAQRLSKFAFNDSSLRQRRELSTSNHVTSHGPTFGEQTARQSTGNYCFLLSMLK